MRVVAEVLLVHLPGLLDKDQPLVHDLLAVVGTALQNIYEDAEQSSKAWDKKAYHVKADELRKEWDWALAAGNYATGLALRPDDVDATKLAKLTALIRPGVERPARHQIPDPARFRGAAAAVKKLLAQKPKPVRG